jgi:DNA mismatch repair protein MutL
MRLFLEGALEGKTEIQKLLLPQVISLNPHSAERARQNAELFSRMGFDIREFGENSFIIHSVPVFIRREAKQVLNEVLSELTCEPEPQDKTHRVIVSLACHSAIKSGDKLSSEEVRELIKEVKNLKTPYCPHGRPALILIKWEDIDSQFGRRQGLKN